MGFIKQKLLEQTKVTYVDSAVPGAPVQTSNNASGVQVASQQATPLYSGFGIDLYTQAEVDQFKKDVQKQKEKNEKEGDLSLWTLNPVKLLKYSVNHTSLFKSDYEKAVMEAAGSPAFGPGEFFDSFTNVIVDAPSDAISGLENLEGSGPVKRLENEVEKLVIIGMIALVGGLVIVKLVEHELD